MGAVEILQGRRDAILTRWESLTRAAVPAARRQTTAALLDDIPLLLDELFGALQGGGHHPWAPVSHAESRARLADYDLEQVIAEYHLLRTVLLDELQDQGPVRWDDLRILLDGIDLGIQEAVARFSRVQTEALRQTEERFRLLVENVKEYALFMLDADGRVATWNQGAIRIKGYEAEEIVGRSFELFYTEEDRAAGLPAQMLGRASAEGVAQVEGWRVRKDGSRFWGHITLTALRDPDGGLRGFAKLTRDITVQRRADEEREQLLGQREAALRTRNHVLRMVGHDLKNPLQTLSFAVEVLRRDGTRDGARRKQVEAIGRAVARLDRLVQDLWDLARLHSGEISVQPRPERPGEMLAELADELQERARLRGLDLRIEAVEELPEVQADRGRVLQVLGNLLDNALKHTPSGGTVSVSAHLQNPATVRFVVQDTGGGMSQEEVGLAFEPYWQAAGARDGSGLGLSIVKAIVEAHGGCVWIDSAPGAGTSVSFTLPLSATPPTVA